MVSSQFHWWTNNPKILQILNHFQANIGESLTCFINKNVENISKTIKEIVVQKVYLSWNI